MIKWVEIDDSRYARPVREGRPGLPPIERAPSIYEIPSRVGVGYDRERPFELSLYVEYISPEPEIERRVSDALLLVVGQHSGRLRKAVVNFSPIFANGRKPNVDEISDYVTAQIVEHLRASIPSDKTERRVSLTGRVLHDHSTRLLQPALAAG